MMAGSALRVTAGVNVSLAVAIAASYATHPGLGRPMTIRCRRVGQLARTVSTLAALASSTMTGVQVTEVTWVTSLLRFFREGPRQAKKPQK